MEYWKSLALDQRRQIEERSNTIDTLNQRLSTFNRQIDDLKFQLAEQNERLSAVGQQSQAPDKLAQLQLRFDLLENNYRQLLKQAHAAEAGRQAVLAGWKQNKIEFSRDLTAARAQHTESNVHANAVQALQTQLNQSRAETQQARKHAEGLTRQLTAANKENAELQGHTASRKARQDQDQDDEEPMPKVKFEQRNSSSSANGVAARPQTLPQRPKTVTAPQPSAPRTIAAQPSAPIPMTPRHPKTAAPVSPPAPAGTPRKRKRAVDDDSITRQELEDLKLSDAQVLPGKRRKSNISMSELDDGFSEDENGVPKFAFNALINWEADGSTGEGYSSEDLQGVMGELWEKIETVRNMWEEAAGGYW